MIYDVGRVCVKIAGRDAGKTCVIVEKIDDRFMLVDGQTRRKKVNVAHLEPTKQVISISSGGDSASVENLLTGAGVLIAKKGLSRSTPARNKKSHKKNEKSNK